jgi:hypothetical protein
VFWGTLLKEAGYDVGGFGFTGSKGVVFVRSA